MPLLGREPGTQAFRELDENPGDETFPGIAVLRLDSGLFFATAEALDDRVRAVIRDSEPPLHALVLDLEGVDFVDSQGAAKLAELYEVAKTDGVTLRLARVKPQVLDVLDADGMVATARRRPHPRKRRSGNRGATRRGRIHRRSGRFAAMMIFRWGPWMRDFLFGPVEERLRPRPAKPHAAPEDLEGLCSFAHFRAGRNGPGRDRTCDLGIKSPLLYQLSYRPAPVSVDACRGYSGPAAPID